MNLNKSIALLGMYPPPIGGVSVHTKILAQELSDRNMINVLITRGKKDSNDPLYLKRIKDIRIFGKNVFWHYKIPFILRLYSKNIRIIHCHEGLCSVPFLFFQRFIFRKSIIHTIHNQWVTERYNKLNFLSKVITNIFLKDKKTFWICVNENALAQMLELGVKDESVSVIPAYIPNAQNKIETIDDISIVQTIKEFKKDFKLIGVYGYKFYYDSSGKEVYGFSFSIDVFKQLIKIKPSIKLVLLIPCTSSQQDKEKIESRIKNEGMSAHILTIFDKPINNMNLFWKQIDIYFRPTTDDGDSLAIREALANGVAVVASNVCTRPIQTITFKALNINSAVDNLKDALEFKQIISVDNDNYLEKILEIYINQT